MQTALEILQARLPNAKPKIAIILGSGWKTLCNFIENPITIPYADLSDFPRPTVEGHSSDLIYGTIGSHEVVILTGRKHAYETGKADGMKPVLRTMRDWGCEVIIQTNAAGSLNTDMPAGSLMAINDHINFSQTSPLIGETGSERFVSMVNAYDDKLRNQAKIIAKQKNEKLYEGVYVWFLGPQFETPAEIRLYSQMADAVGMSTVPETIIARHLGMKVMAFSLITNMAAGMSDEQLSHEHTLAQAANSSQRASELLRDIVIGLDIE